MDFNVILVVSGDDLLKIDLVSKNINDHIRPRNIVIITNDVSKASSIVSASNVKVVDESDLLKPYSSEEINEIKAPGFPGRYFWYYQQFLKMIYAFHCTDDYYLIWDADTIPIRDMSFIKDRKPVFTEGEEKLHGEYAQTYLQILHRPMVSDVSFISQHLMVETNVMVNLIEELGGKANFHSNILHSLSGSTLSQFSEYETYVNYYLSERNKAIFRKRKWFRYGSSLIGFQPSQSDLNKLAKYYDYIAFEKFDKGAIYKIRAWVTHLKNTLINFFSAKKYGGKHG